MGYEFRPEALEATLRYASAMAHVPLLITENGVATDDDAQRIEFIDGLFLTGGCGLIRATPPLLSVFGC